MQELLEKRLGPNASKGFYETIKKTDHKTFASMYKVEVKTKPGQTKTVKADRKMMKRLFSAAHSGRNVNVKQLVQHELSPVPLSLAHTNGTLLLADKPPLAHLLGDSCATDILPQPVARTCTIIDAMGLINAKGNKSGKATTFGKLADTITQSVFEHFSETCPRVDVIFDSYRQNSVKQGTRDARSLGTRQIRRVIDQQEISLPDS